MALPQSKLSIVVTRSGQDFLVLVLLVMYVKNADISGNRIIDGIETDNESMYDGEDKNGKDTKYCRPRC